MDVTVAHDELTRQYLEGAIAQSLAEAQNVIDNHGGPTDEAAVLNLQNAANYSIVLRNLHGKR